MNTMHKCGCGIKNSISYLTPCQNKLTYHVMDALSVNMSMHMVICIILRDLQHMRPLIVKQKVSTATAGQEKITDAMYLTIFQERPSLRVLRSRKPSKLVVHLAMECQPHLTQLAFCTKRELIDMLMELSGFKEKWEILLNLFMLN